jgi:hypothetical protein
MRAKVYEDIVILSLQNKCLLGLREFLSVPPGLGVALSDPSADWLSALKSHKTRHTVWPFSVWFAA